MPVFAENWHPMTTGDNSDDQIRNADTIAPLTPKQKTGLHDLKPKGIRLDQQRQGLEMIK